MTLRERIQTLGSHIRNIGLQSRLEEAGVCQAIERAGCERDSIYNFLYIKTGAVLKKYQYAQDVRDEREHAVARSERETREEERRNIYARVHEMNKKEFLETFSDWQGTPIDDLYVLARSIAKATGQRWLNHEDPQEWPDDLVALTFGSGTCVTRVDSLLPAGSGGNHFQINPPNGPMIGVGVLNKISIDEEIHPGDILVRYERMLSMMTTTTLIYRVRKNGSGDLEGKLLGHATAEF